MGYAAWSVIHGEQPSATKWNVLGSNDAHFYSFLGANTAWQSWTPSWTNFTVGSSTVTAYYTQIGRYVRVSVNVVLGAGFALTASNLQISNPVAGLSLYNATGSRGGAGWSRMIDASALNYHGTMRMESPTTAIPEITRVDGATYCGVGGIKSTEPFTWVATDSFYFEWEYEAAA